MFWRVASFNQSSAVEGVLDRPDYTLEDLLEEDDLIQVRKTWLPQFTRHFGRLHPDFI